MQLNAIDTVAVLGTGNMGPGIAFHFARAGFRVFLWGRSEQSKEKGLTGFNKVLQDLQLEEIISEIQANEIAEKVNITSDLRKAVADAQFVVEAITENLEIKQDLFSKLEQYTSKNTIYASCTSTLLPSSISEKLVEKDRFLLTHFWNPAYLAMLVEVCGSPFTSELVVYNTMELLKKIGSEPVLVKKEIPGFIGNLIMHAMNREALHLIGEGVCTAEDIDKVVHASFGPRFTNLGPMEYLDFVGLDLIKAIQGYLYEDLNNTPGISNIIDELVEQGNLGRKTGRGLFDWSQKDGEKVRLNRDQEFLRRLKAKKHEEE